MTQDSSRLAPLPALRAVLIDLDGTLMDTAPDLALAANRMRAEFALPPLPTARIASFVGKGADVREKKPHPALLLEALRQLDLPARDALMIGDSGNDALASAAAGLRAILVETGYNEGEPVASLADGAGVDVIVPTIVQAAEIILQRLAARPNSRTDPLSTDPLSTNALTNRRYRHRWS